LGRERAARSFLAEKGLLFVTVKVLLSLLLVTQAVVLQVSPTTQESLTGGSLNITSSLVGADKGFSKAGASSGQTAGPCPGSSVAFGASPGNATNAITASDIIYHVQVNTTDSTPPSTCFTVTLVITPSDDSPTTFNAYVSTGVSVVAGQTIDCKFDIGSSIPSSPFSFKVTVT